MNIEDDDIILIAGPTASGKTQLALKIAQANDAVIINADSMQVYRELQIITARPGPEEVALCPHFLFGHVPAIKPYSVAAWLDEASHLITKFRREGRQIVFAGGTGLYFTALIKGLSPIPPINPDIRAKWRRRQERAHGNFHKELLKLDPEAAKGLEPGDTQRIIRALEVYESTGISVTKWRKTRGTAPLPGDARVTRYLLFPPRPVLHRRIEARFDAMLEAGCLQEVKALVALSLPATLPVMKAIGVPQFTGYLAGKITLDEAVTRAKAATRQYAKRQSTWFRNTFDKDWEIIVGSEGASSNTES